MKLFRFALLALILISQQAYSKTITSSDSLSNPVPLIDLDATLDSLIKTPKSIQEITIEMNDSTLADTASIQLDYKKVRNEVRKLLANKLIIDFDPIKTISKNILLPLVTYNEHRPLDYRNKLNTYNLFEGKKPAKFWVYESEKTNRILETNYVQEFQRNAFINILTSKPELIAYHESELPTTDDVKNRIIEYDYKESAKYINYDDFSSRKRQKLVVEKVELGPWTRRANAYLQFSENYVSKNWHQGGSSNIAILGTVTAKFNYDNKKNIQWENSGEWRAGFHSIEGDTTRIFNTNDDIIKIYSKLGIKAGGDFFYSAAFDFSTPMFPTYKAINSTVLKADFMTPVRINLGLGMDYKYKKFISVMVSPISYKYIYLNNKKIDPKLFGIKPGEHKLSELGSSIKVQGNYAASKEMTFESKLAFFTNYDKIEIDWELKGNFQINRFLSTRIMLNPRYDNSVIETGSNKAKLQFKQLLTFGLAYRILN